ncbi:heat shock 70 kDa protein 12B-like [Ruditapes philippinarum]|uniref:heat shock 70 kDa protein 12B-like n=1 Tax=Ruditapes philippinarum TaxID=129788 RepID=UPI00295AB967|nr:heat shock 70 kDa protein 12B-like [Ruditapes philippinarum]
MERCRFKQFYEGGSTGGGTVDITVHEVSDSGKLRELHKASGGAWGGTQVDKAYEEGLLANIVGPEVVSKFKRQYMEDYIEFCHSFDGDKRHISPTKPDGKVTIRMIPSLSQLCEEMRGN